MTTTPPAVCPFGCGASESHIIGPNLYLPIERQRTLRVLRDAVESCSYDRIRDALAKCK